MYTMSMTSIITPPSIVPMNMPKLDSNKKIPFANSGAPRMAEVTQYCETVYADPSNIANTIKMQNS